MSKKKLLLTGYRAFGDWIYASAALPYLFDQYDVYCDMNLKGDSLFHDDPRFAEKAVFVFENQPPSEYARLISEREALMREQISPDAEINLNGTLEWACVARKEQEAFYYPVGSRRVVYGGNGFYDAIFDRCGMQTPNPLRLSEGLWFPPELEASARAWREKFKGRFIIIIPVSGSCIHKKFRNFVQVCEALLKKYDDALIYLCGDTKDFGYSHDRVKCWFAENMPIKQVMLGIKHANLCIGPETGLMVAAGMWGTPKIMINSASSVWQTSQYQLNDFSFQAQMACSPCHLSVFEPTDCENIKQVGGEKIPACSIEFPLETILERAEYVYRNLQ